MRNFDFIARANPEYVDELYRRYREDPSSVDEEWALVFSGYEFAQARGLRPMDRDLPERGPAKSIDAPGPGREPRIVGVFDLVHSYRELGHLIADLDPLGHSPRSHPLLKLEEFGFTRDDLEMEVEPGSFRGLDRVPLKELLQALKETYCRTLGVEFLDIREKEKRDWLQDRMEPSRNRPQLAPAERKELLRKLIAAEGFERFLHTKYVGQKRFSLEGGEALVPLMEQIIDDSANAGAEEMVLGMPHRGRLNVLANVLHKPVEMILAEFEGIFFPADILGAGDVKYHLGYSKDRETPSGRRIHLSLSYNPSHLEIINPVVEGIVRAKQDVLKDHRRNKVVPVLLHGDAAFAGQGVVYETLGMSGLAGYTTGGTIHIIVNNQVGFTTGPDEGRSTHYASDLAQVIQAPVFHVNGDDPEACLQAARLAVGFRQQFNCDVIIDFICVRKHGHNELDDPTFTQPAMYREITERASTTEQYVHRLVAEGVVGEDDVEAMRQAYRDDLERAHDEAKNFMPQQEMNSFGGLWTGLTWAAEDWSAETRVDKETLLEVARSLPRLPEDFTPHKRMPKMLEQMKQMVESGDQINWAVGETLAYGSLLLEGTQIRLTGQDSERGTFSHRHAVLMDQETSDPHIPLNHIRDEQAQLEIHNSPLNEMGVLGFEYGVASADPNKLVIWEAQFGDFANGAQVVIDQFIASGESKWHRANGLVMLLPHGYEGQGPEHSSARPERFLQLCAEDNMQVVNCTTPAQLFHVMRRQMRRNFRKPLVVMSPKSLLRHKRCVSRLSEFTDVDFRPVLPDPAADALADVQRVLLCSGKIYYTLEEAREERERWDVAIVRLEQLYPFPFPELQQILAPYSKVEDFCWVQEEPWNQGAWQYAMPRLNTLLGDQRRPRYIGRPEAASPATGNYKIHRSEEQELVNEALKKPGLPTASDYLRSIDDESDSSEQAAG